MSHKVSPHQHIPYHAPVSLHKGECKGLCADHNFGSITPHVERQVRDMYFHTNLESKYLTPTLIILNECLLQYGAPKLQSVVIPTFTRRPDRIDMKFSPVAMSVVTFYCSLRSGKEQRTVYMPEAITRELDRSFQLCLQFKAAFGMLTDETLSVVVNAIDRLCYPEDPLVLEPGTPDTDTDPVQFTIAAMIHAMGAGRTELLYNQYPTFRPYLGAMIAHAPTVLSLDEAISARHAFEDWDLFTMQRSREEWYPFEDWQHELRGHAMSRPLDPLPPEAHSVFATQARCRDDSVDAVLREDRIGKRDVVSTVSEVRRSGGLGYSQVVFGTLANSNTRLCLKLYDERFFAVEEVDNYDDPLVRSDLAQRFNNLLTAINPARNEEAVYDRASRAHCSALVMAADSSPRQVELPDIATVWGLLTEFIGGPTIEQIDARDWYKATQTDFRGSIDVDTTYPSHAPPFQGTPVCWGDAQ
ncbi:hypothetical protein CERSUDRAFT_75970 [Gelatoporia subvermispora B]|uniref:Uncharacterized protein n=1 Tax=Ceriporiopsis subvermispora (strain B) TaxID=914234 RepID=M2R6Z9_CERS8|nr:hypothetical protein CERSUDRAFT_75970 [Gelatoporia subvermispora B]